jgi:membrane protein DedA with SNARE-associated domain
MPDFSFQEWIELFRTFYDQHGYLIVFLSALGENTAIFGLLLPGNSLVLLGAFYARLGSLNLGLVILWATLGTILGYHLDFLFGRFILVNAITRWSSTKLGRRLRLAGRLRLAQMQIRKHGGKAILISHLAGHLRSFVAISAGMIGMPYHTFLIFEIIAATLWNTLYALLGYFIAIEVDQLSLLLQRIGGGIFVLFILLFCIWRFFSRYMKQRIWKAEYTSRHKKRIIKAIHLYVFRNR